MTWRDDLVSGLNAYFSGINPQLPLEGWGRVKWGDYIDKVQLNYLDAGESNGSLVLEPDDPVRRKYSISFNFDQQRTLESVTLKFEGSQETRDFAPLIRALNDRFGAPVAETEDSVTWQRDDSQNQLSQNPQGGVVLSELI